MSSKKTIKTTVSPEEKTPFFEGNGFVASSVKMIERPIFKKRDKNAHKGTFKTAVSVTGSYGMSGAAVMSSLAALRSGLGILKAAVIHENYEILGRSVPEAVLLPCDGNNGHYSRSAVHKIKEHLKGASAVLVGCGMGNNRETAYLTREIALASPSPVIIDADGINAVAGDIEFIKQMKAPLIFTPHPGEMSRLCGKTVAEIESDRIGIARDFAVENGVWLVLKGANTLVATPSGELFMNTTGNPGMATGGSGDILAGIMLTLTAQNEDITSAVCNSVWLHGKAGDKAAEKMGEASLLPRDILNELPSLFKNE